MRIKKETERRMEVLGFDCFFDLKTGNTRHARSGFKGFVLHTSLVLHNIYRIFMGRIMGIKVTIEYNIHPNEGESLMEMANEMADMVEKHNGGL